MKRLAVPLLVLACLAPAALQKRKQQSQNHIPDQVRAMQFRMGAESEKSTDLEVSKPGPFMIE